MGLGLWVEELKCCVAVFCSHLMATQLPEIIYGSRGKPQVACIYTSSTETPYEPYLSFLSSLVSGATSVSTSVTSCRGGGTTDVND